MCDHAISRDYISLCDRGTKVIEHITSIAKTMQKALDGSEKYDDIQPVLLVDLADA